MGPHAARGQCFKVVFVLRAFSKGIVRISALTKRDQIIGNSFFEIIHRRKVKTKECINFFV